MSRTDLGMAMAAALCGLMIGCGGGSVSIDDLGNTLINGYCDRLVRCGVISSHDTCVGLYKQFLDFTTVTATVKAGTATYDGEKAQSCVDALAGASCDPSQKDERVTPQDCKDAIKGTVADGGACKNGNECVSGSCNIPSCTMACCPGTCNPTPPAAVAIGQSCANAPCVDGAYCNNGTCAALIAAGGTCISDTDCAYGTVCAGGGVGGGALTCTAAPKAGDACLTHNGNNDCVVDGLACDATAHCVALLDTGKTCDPQVQSCKLDLKCDGTAKTCGTLPATGQSCVGSACAPGNYCDPVSANCAAQKANGTACTNGVECSSGNCDSTSNQCAARVACT